MYEFWYDYKTPKYGDNARLCYMDTLSCMSKQMIFTSILVIMLIIGLIHLILIKMIIDHQKLEKNKKVIGKFKDELGGKIMSEFCALRAKTYLFLIDDYSDVDYEKNKITNKKSKGTKKCIVKREIIFKNYVDSLFNGQVLIKSQQRFRSDHHKVSTEEVNKIALSTSGDKRMQTFDKVTTYPYGANVFMACENEMKYK